MDSAEFERRKTATQNLSAWHWKKNQSRKLFRIFKRQPQVSEAALAAKATLADLEREDNPEQFAAFCRHLEDTAAQFGREKEATDVLLLIESYVKEAFLAVRRLNEEGEMKRGQPDERRRFLDRVAAYSPGRTVYEYLGRNPEGNLSIYNRSRAVASLTHMPPFVQQTDYTCGAAAVAMALGYFGIRKTEAELIPLLKTTEEIGTWADEMTAYFESIGFLAVRKLDTSIDDIVRFMNDGYVVIVMYHMVEDYTVSRKDDPYREVISHYSVVLSIDRQRILLANPYYGKPQSLSLASFSKFWSLVDRDERVRSSFVAAKPAES